VVSLELGTIIGLLGVRAARAIHPSRV